MRYTSWIRGLQLLPCARKPFPAARRAVTPRLDCQHLEDRLNPVDFRDVAGLRFLTPDQFTPTGATAAVTDSPVQVGLTPTAGGKFNPLLTLPGGVSVNTGTPSATVNSTLTAGGLTFTGKDLAFGFDQPNKKFTLSGDAAFTAGGVTVATKFGAPGSATPGLVIQNGKLAAIDVGVSSDFTVGKVLFHVQDLRLKFDTAAGNRYAISGGAKAEFSVGTSPVTVAARFGESAAKPGLVIVDGKLTDLSVGVSSSFAVEGVTFEAKDLTLTFNSQKNTYGMSGTVSAKFQAGGSTPSVALNFGTAAQPGLVIVDGRLDSLNAAITSDFTVAGVAVRTRALGFTFDRQNKSFGASGSAGLTFTGTKNAVNLDVQIGKSAAQPGLVVVNGQLTDLSVGVTGEFTVAGLKVRAKELTFTFNRQQNTYGMFGRVSVSTAADGKGRRVLDDFTVQLGTGSGALATPGLLVRNGALDKIDFTLNGSINLASLTVAPQNLRVTFTRASNLLQFTGGFTASLASKFNASIDLPNGGLTINTDTGAVQLNGLRLALADTKLGPVGIRGAFVQYTSDGAGSFDLSGGAVVDLPAGLTVTGSFDVVNGRLRRILLAASKDPGFPIGNTGVFANSISAEVLNLDDPGRLQVTGTVGFTAGPSFRISGRSVALVQGTVGVELDVGQRTLTLSGKMSLIGDAIPVGSGTIVFRFDPVNPRSAGVTARLDVNLFAGFVVGSLDLDLRATGDVTIRATANLVIPPVRIGPHDIGGITLASVSIAARLLANDPVNSSISFSASVLGGTISADATVTFGGRLTVNARLIGLPVPTVTVNLPPLVRSTTPVTPPPPPPPRPTGPTPGLRILTAERVAGSSTNDLRVSFQANSFDVPSAIALFHLADTDSPGSLTHQVAGFKLAQAAAAGATFDSATGVGSFVVRNPESRVPPGRPFFVTGAIDDKFDTNFDVDAFGPVQPVFGPLQVFAPRDVNGPLNAPFDGLAIEIADPAAANDTTGAARVTVSISYDSPGELGVPAAQLPTSVTVDGNGTNSMTLTGPTADVNAALDRLTLTRFTANVDSFVSVFANRDPDPGDGTKSAFIRVRAAPFRVLVPFVAPPYNQGDPPTPAFTDRNTTNRTTVEADVSTRIISAEVAFFVSPDVELSPYERGADKLDVALPLGSPLTATFNVVTGVLNISGPGSPADYTAALDAVTFFSTGTPGTTVLTVRLADSRGNTSETPISIDITDTGKLFIPPVVEPRPLVNPGVGGAKFAGDPVAVMPDVTADYIGTGKVISATVAFTGLFDATADMLMAPAVPGLTVAFDQAAGVLTLTGGATTTVDDFETALKGVMFDSKRANPIPYPREVTVTLTTGKSDSPTGPARTLVQVEAPDVPPQTTATTAPLTVPPNAAAMPVLPDFRAVYPDAALPPPSVPLGAFVPGTVLTGGSVAIATNYVPGEDVLTFTPSANVTGTFVPETGLLLLYGTATLAEYEQVIRSVQYQNRNTSPSTLDRMVVVTLDDGSAGNPATVVRAIRPQSDGKDTTRTAGTINPLVIPPTTREASLGLTDLNYTPRPGESELVYTIVDTPQESLGFVRLADGTTALPGMEVTIEQLRGATFVASDTPRSGTVPFAFTVAGVNPITGVPTPTPLVVTLPIRTLNVAPVAADDAVSLPANAPTAFDVLGNDTDVNQEVLQFVSFTQPANGKVEMTDDLSFKFTPNPGFVGTDTFTYTITDGAGGTATAAVILTVTPTNRAALVGFPQFAVGQDAGGGAVTLYNPDQSVRFTVTPFESSFTGGVRTAAADFNGDGIADLIVGTGTGRSTRVVVFDGATQKQLFAVDPFEATFTGGVYVAAGDLNGDGVPELVVTPDEGGGPRVRVFDGAGVAAGNQAVVADFFGIDDPDFRGGARAAVGDVDGDGAGDLIVAAGFQGGPRVAGFGGRSLGGGSPARVFPDFFAFEQTLRNGTFVAAGDLDGDGKAEVIAGGGPGGGPRVTAFSGAGLLGGQFTPVANFFGGNPDSRGGIRVAAKDLDGDEKADVVVGAGAGAGGRATGYFGKDIPAAGTPAAAFDFDAAGGFTGGVYVG